MIKNYLIIGLRNIFRQKAYSLINIAGLAIGVTACMLILLYIQYETSFETIFSQAQRTYRVLTIDKALGTNNQRVGITMPPVGPNAPAAIPEVESTLRISSANRTLLIYGDKPGIYAEKMCNTDTNFFDFFDFKLLKGDPQTALSEPYTIILTESLAKAIFGDDEPMGNVLRTASGKTLKVTGIMTDLPKNTHLDFDALGSLLTAAANARENRPPNSTRPIWLENWNMVAMPTYARLHSNVNLDSMDAKFTDFIRKNGVAENFVITLQPLLDVHLKSTDVIFDDIKNKGDINNVYTFAVIALLILVIASVNYMNLSTARSAQRAREVGIRKVAGSSKTQLIGKFLGESLLLTLIALIIALPLAAETLPWLNSLNNSDITFDLLHNSLLVIFSLGMLLIVGLLAGLYPALVLTSFKPVIVLKGSFRSGKKGAVLRKALVVFQYTLSIALISMAILVQKQMYYIHHKDLGYDREQVLILDMLDPAMGANITTLKNELSKHSAFTTVGLSGDVPGRTFGRTRVRPEGASEKDIWIWSYLGVTPETFPTLGMEIVQGRNFSREIASDTSDAVIVNQTAVAKVGWKNPLDMRVYFGPQDSVGVKVIGVVKDFHFISLQQVIEPVLILQQPDEQMGLVAARIEKGRIPEAMKYAEQKWREIFPSHPFKYSFLDDEFDHLYRRDINSGKIIYLFSGLAIFIACLGLFGLASHSITQRTKEIGVRKVLGASAAKIVGLLVLDFIKWVVLANIFAWPLAYFAMKKWLQNYAYATDIGIEIFIISALMAITIAVLTVSLQSVKAALSDPAKSLRCE